MKQREANAADAAPSESPTPCRQAPRSRGKGGAPALNANAVKHGANLNEAKRTVRATRDTHRRRAEREARAVLVEAGLEGSALAGLVSKQLRRLETVASRIEGYLEHRGYFTRHGEVKPSVRSLVDTTDKLLGEARRMLDQLAEQGLGGANTVEEARAAINTLVARFPGALTTEYRFVAADGEPIELGGFGARPPAALPAPNGAGDYPISETAIATTPAWGDTPPSSLIETPGPVVDGVPLPAHPLDVRQAKAAPVLVQRPPVTIESPLARAWADGDDL